MPRSLVGRVKNREFAYFWLLIGGSIGSIIMLFASPYDWQVFLFPSALSISMAIAIANKKKRPKIWLGMDLLLTSVLLVLLVPPGTNLAAFLPGGLIILGCILGIMDW